MASLALGTPESPSICSPVPGTSKGAQLHFPKKCGVSACYSVPLARSYSNQDTPTAVYCPPKASVNWPQWPGRQCHAGLTLLTLQLSQFQGCRWSAHRLTATRRLYHLHCSSFANQFPIIHVPVPKHHLHCSPLGGLIMNRSSTTSLLPNPSDLLRSHWSLRVSAELFT